MRINKIHIQNFRNHKSKTLDFDPKLTVITGNNGVGKTNILESIFVLATAKSPRARYDRDLVNYEHEFCSISAKVDTDEDKYELDLQIIKRDNDSNISSKKAKVNKVIKSITGFTGIFNAVMFIPEDIAIITGSPAERRRFMDLILSQTDKHYKKSLSDYTKTVRQRNKLLEKINLEGKGYDQMGFWNEQLSKHGTVITTKRLEFIEFANSQFPEILKNLDKENTRATIKYKESKINKETLEKYYEREIASKNTLIGPHREDFEIIYNEHNIAEFGSRGQQRTILLSLKLIEIGFIEKTKKERPVLLLDDIFSELDDAHRKSLLNSIQKQQTIISSAETTEILGIEHNFEAFKSIKL